MGITIDPYSVSTVPIEMLFNGQFLSLGTAFVWSDSGQFRLVTNWHNLTGLNPKTGNHLSKTAAEPNQIRVWWNVKGQLGNKAATVLPLRAGNGMRIWWSHPTLREQVDVAVLPVAIPAHVEPYPINEMEKAELLLQIGMDLFVLGYPFGIGTGGLPVWKRASFASEPELIDNPQQRFLLVDTASRPGMSGSPVIRRSWGSAHLENGVIKMGRAFATRLVGIYSGRLETADPLDAQLGMVWPVKYIEEVIAGQSVQI